LGQNRGWLVALVRQVFAADPDRNGVVDPVGRAGAEEKIIGRGFLRTGDRIEVLPSRHQVSTTDKVSGEIGFQVPVKSRLLRVGAPIAGPRYH